MAKTTPNSKTTKNKDEKIVKKQAAKSKNIPAKEEMKEITQSAVVEARAKSRDTLNTADVISDKDISSVHSEISQVSPKSKLPIFTVPQIIALLVGVASVSLTLWVSLYYIPYLNDQTDQAKFVKSVSVSKSESVSKEKETEARLAVTDRELKVSEKSQWQVDMQIQIDGGSTDSILINLNRSSAPDTVLNFLRLSYQGYYNNMAFHRMVVQDTFKVIQGGDPVGDGTGGETASGKELVDELWSVAPVFEDSEGSQTKIITNSPVFRDPSLYSNFNKETGSVTYRKGLIIMAKSSLPNSANSQFFLTLDETILPAEYTAFGTVDESSLPVLDKILSQVKVLENPENPVNTKPDKTVLIKKVEVK